MRGISSFLEYTLTSRIPRVVTLSWILDVYLRAVGIHMSPMLRSSCKISRLAFLKIRSEYFRGKKASIYITSTCTTSTTIHNGVGQNILSMSKCKNGCVRRLF